MASSAPHPFPWTVQPGWSWDFSGPNDFVRNLLADLKLDLSVQLHTHAILGSAPLVLASKSMNKLLLQQI